MAPLLQPTQQGERPEAHNAPPSAAPAGHAGQTPGLPAAPSMREVPAQAPLLPLVTPPPAPAEPVRSSLPTLAIGGKRSATDAGLEADPNTDGKRLKVSHATNAGTVRLQQAQEEGMGMDLDGVREQDTGTQLTGEMPAQSEAVVEWMDYTECVRLTAWLDSIIAWLKMLGIDNKAMHFDIALLHMAIDKLQVAIVQSLLKVPGNDANATHLHMAVENGQVDIVQFLLKIPGINVNATNVEKQTPLHIAIEKGQVAIVQALLKMPGIDVNAIDIYDQPVLHMAVKKGNVDIVQGLLRAPDVNVNAMYLHQTPLHIAVNKGHVAIVQFLLETPGIDFAAQDRHGDTALRIAWKMEAAAIIDALLAAQGVNACSGEFLARHIEFLAAAEAGDLARVRFLLATTPWLDVNFEKKDKTALKLAVGKSHLEVVQKLLAMPGIVVDRDTCAEIAKCAAQKGHLQLFRLILDRPDFDVNDNRNPGPYLVIAAENGHFPIVQALLAAPGIDVNARCSKGRTALLAACRTNNSNNQIAILLAAMPNTDVNVHANGCCYTPLLLAATFGNLPLVRALLAAERINVNVYALHGFTPLMCAAGGGHLEIVQALLAMPGTDVDHCSDFSFKYPECVTALSLAEWKGRRQVVDALLAMPVSPGFYHRDLHKSLLEKSRRAPPKPEKKQATERTYRFLRQILHPGFEAGTLLPLLLPDQQQRPSWLEQKCTDVSLGTCPVTDVPFLLKSTMPLPAWCQAALANAIALGFTAGHYRSTPPPLWQALQQGQAWLAGLAFGASESRQDAIELDAGISHELEAMGLWNEFLNTLETLRKLKADPDGVHLDNLTLLGWAARDGDLPMIRYLVALGANIHLRSPNGDAPILAAARAGQWAACAELLSLGAMPYRVDRNGYPALFHIASAFANSDTASLALARLIRYLRLKHFRFDIPVPNPDDETRTENPTVLISDILVSNPEPWVLFGKDVFGVREAPLPALAAVPTLPAAQLMAPTTPKADIHAMLQSADPVAAVAAWLDADPQRLRWQDPDNGEGLLHLAAAAHNIGLVRLLLDRGVDRRHADRAGQTAAQLLPAEYMSSHTPAVADIAALLR